MRLRREQFLQEHKEMGKLVLKMAKSTVNDQEIERNQEEKLMNHSVTTAVDLNMMTHEQVNLIIAGVLVFPLTTNIQEQKSSNCKIDIKTEVAKDESKNSNMKVLTIYLGIFP